MNRTYKWKIPKSFLDDEEHELEYLSWISDFASQLCYVFAQGLREKLGFTYDDYGFSQDDFNYAIEFKRGETVFVVDFGFEKEEAETFIFDVFINVINLKKIIFIYRRIEPAKEIFEEFHKAVMEIAMENNILSSEK